MKSLICVLSFLPLVVACSDGDPAVYDIGVADSSPAVEAGLDAGVEASTPDGGRLPLTLAKGGTGHSKVGDTLKTGQVRAGKVTDKIQLLAGIKTQGQVGDFKIYNDKVAFIIQDARTSHGWAPWGGEVLDAERLGQKGNLGRSLLGEAVLAVGVRIMTPTSVGVVNDGSDGKAAIIRAMGTPKVVPYLAAMVGDSFGAELEIYIVFDFVLEPDSEALEVRWRLINALNTKQEMPLSIFAFQAGDGADFYGEGNGFKILKYNKVDYVAMISRPMAQPIPRPESIGYTWISPTERLTPLIEQSGVWALSGTIVTVPAAGEHMRKLYLAVTEGTPEAVRRQVRKIMKKTDPPKLTGKVTDPAGKAVAGLRVHVQTDDATKSHVTMGLTDSTGKYELTMAAGNYLLTVTGDGRAPASAVKASVGASGSTKDLTIGGVGTVSFEVQDQADSSTTMPAKLVFLPKTKFPTVSSSMGEPSHPHGAALVVYSATGKGTGMVPPGQYTVNISHGFEYEVAKQSITVTDGQTSTVKATLKRSVDTTGYMNGDFHLHAMWSPDSNDLNDFKVSTIVASGVELPVTTDHEFIADYNPAIAKLGVQKWAYGIVGEELTTLVYGHFNPFPITADTSKPNNNAMIWAHKSPAKLFADVRAAWPTAVMQVNHPRSAAIGGYFTYVGYNASTGKAETKPKEWSRNFDAFEVTNGSSWDSNHSRTVQDWFSFLNRGFLVTGTGNSDSHHAYKSQVGYPRNYVKLSTDSPSKLSLSEFVSSVKKQKLLISGGPFMTVDVGGKGMGEVASAKGGSATVKVKVQAPTWMKVDKLRVYVGGTLAKTITLDSSTADPKNPVVRYNAGIPLTVKADSFVIVVASSSGSLSPVSNGSPFCASNPIYLDFDGNGAYDAPMTF